MVPIFSVTPNLSNLEDTDGCKGGFSTFAFEYNKEKGRMASLEDLPYMKVDRACDENNLPENAMRDAVVTGVTRQDKETDIGMREALEFGAVVVAIWPSPAWRQYREGIFSCELPTCGCSSKPSSHSVTVTGYEKGYWVVKNSW